MQAAVLAASSSRAARRCSGILQCGVAGRPVRLVALIEHAGAIRRILRASGPACRGAADATRARAASAAGGSHRQMGFDTP